MKWARGPVLFASALVVLGSMPEPVLAGRRVSIAEGTAGPDAQGAAAFLALFPIVAILVFALARWVGWRA